MSKYLFTVGILNLNYRYILIAVLLVLLSACADKKTFPPWYLNLDVHSYEVIGYGSGKTLQIAKSIAREDIAKSLVVHVKSAFRADESRDGNITKQKISSYVNQYSDVVLTEAKLVNSTKLGDRFYVAMSYENLPLAQKVYKVFKDIKLPEMQESIYKNSLFSKRLDKLFGYIPEYKLFFKNNLYHLYIADKTFIINDTDLSLFLSEKQSDKLILNASSKHLHVSEYFHFNILTKVSGYLSLLQVDEEGRVIVHIENLVIKADKKLIYPDLEKYDGLEAGIVNQKNSVSEEYLALVCQNKIDFTLFEHISQEFNKNIKTLRYPEVDKIIDGCTYTSIIVKIRKKV